MSKVFYQPPIPVGYFTVSNVLYRGEKTTHRLLEKLTDPVRAEKLVELYNREKPLGNPYPPDSKLIFAIAASSYDSRKVNSFNSEKIRIFLRDSIFNGLNTTTRPIYSPQNEDAIVHNYGTRDAEIINVKITERDAFLRNLSDKRILEALFDTDDVRRINNVLRWISGFEGFIGKPDDDPKEKEDKVFGFYIEDGKFGLDCDGSLAGEFPSFLVKRE